jgi:hypothetical protein
MQTVIAIVIGIAAFVYVLKIIINQLSQSEKNPKCENCPIPELMKSSRENK